MTEAWFVVVLLGIVCAVTLTACLVSLSRWCDYCGWDGSCSLHGGAE